MYTYSLAVKAINKKRRLASVVVGFLAAEEHLRVLAQLLLRDDVGVLRRLHQGRQLAQLLLPGQKHARNIPTKRGSVSERSAPGTVCKQGKGKGQAYHKNW